MIELMEFLIVFATMVADNVITTIGNHRLFVVYLMETIQGVIPRGGVSAKLADYMLDLLTALLFNCTRVELVDGMLGYIGTGSSEVMVYHIDELHMDVIKIPDFVVYTFDSVVFYTVIPKRGFLKLSKLEMDQFWEEYNIDCPDPCMTDLSNVKRTRSINEVLGGWKLTNQLQKKTIK